MGILVAVVRLDDGFVSHLEIEINEIKFLNCIMSLMITFKQESLNFVTWITQLISCLQLRYIREFTFFFYQ